MAVDPEIKERMLKRLRRIEGQVRGLQKMVEEDRYCADILTQVSSVQEALRGVGRELMRNHLEPLRHRGDPVRRGDRAEAMYDELMDLDLPQRALRRRPCPAGSAGSATPCSRWYRCWARHSSSSTSWPAPT